MGTKLLIKGTDFSFDLLKGTAVPKEGESIVLTLKGEKEEKLYTVYHVEHIFDFNMSVTFGNTIITLEEVKPKKSGV